MKNRYVMPTRTFKVETIKELGDLEFMVGVSKAVVVTGNRFLDKTGLWKKLNTVLTRKKIKVQRFKVLQNDPPPEVADECAKFIKEYSPDLVIAIGGGSVLDTAKAAALLAKHPGKCKDYLDKKRSIVKKGFSVAAIPTTIGTGSEVTPFSVFSMGMTKRTLDHLYNFPDYAVLINEPVKFLPKDVLASSVVDALSQSVEGFWARRNNFISQSLVIQSAKMIFKEAASAYRGNFKSRCYLLEAAYIAGLGFSNTRTTACHAISYPLTMRWGIPHGQACILTVSPVLKRNYKVKKKELDAFFAAVGFKNINDFQKGLRKLLASLKVSPRLRDFGVKKEDIPFIVDNAFSKERIANNPVQFKRKDIKKILEEVF